MRIEHADLLLEVMPDQRYRFAEIRVVRDHDGAIELVLVGIADEVCRDVDVRALLLGLDHTNEPWLSGYRRFERHRDGMAEVVPEMDPDHGQGPECTQIGLLASRLVRIAEARADAGGVVVDPST